MRPVLAIEEDRLVFLRRTDEADLECRRKAGQGLTVMQVDIATMTGEREDAIQRAAVEPMKAEPRRQPARHQTLADAARTVDRDDRRQARMHGACACHRHQARSEEHTSELQSLMRIS